MLNQHGRSSLSWSSLRVQALQWCLSNRQLPVGCFMKDIQPGFRSFTGFWSYLSIMRFFSFMDLSSGSLNSSGLSKSASSDASLKEKRNNCSCSFFLLMHENYSLLRRDKLLVPHFHKKKELLLQFQITFHSSLFTIHLRCAEGGTRTPMSLRTHAPETCVSTNSTTSAKNSICFASAD